MALELFRAGLFAPVACGLAALATLPASAAEIGDPLHGVTISYDAKIWSASVDAETVTLYCMMDSCGGEIAECDTFTSVAKNGVDPEKYFSDFLDIFTKQVAAHFRDNDWSPEIVDAAENSYEAGRLVGISSIRFTQDSGKKRAWFAQIGEPFGVIVLQCYGEEARFEAAKAQWMQLANGIAEPKP